MLWPGVWLSASLSQVSVLDGSKWFLAQTVPFTYLRDMGNVHKEDKILIEF